MPEILSLLENNCRDCYKCIRTCSVKAIRFSQSRAEIIPDECILCGSCFVVCPQKAKQVRSDVELVRKAVSSGRRVVCSLAPSFIAEFPVSSLDDMKEALSRLGIADTEETAVGAQMVSDRYAEIMRQGKTPVLISSCCPTINLLIQKYYPDMLPYLAKVLTPMEAHCKLLKEKDPSCFTVFIGPCIAKKDEADHSSYADAALTYDELRSWLQSANVEIKMNDLPEQSGMRARFYPATGGVLKATDKIDGYRRVAIDGVDNCRAVFEELKSGSLKNVFIEMNACEGGCINGPSIREHRERRLRGALRVDRFAGDGRFEIEKEPQSLSHDFAFIGTGRVSVGSAAVQEMLRKMGKTSPEKELNCGCCGYPTCRDKAVAILQGKAQLEMCLPFLKEKAESFSDEILRNTPNAVIVMDENLTVQQINRAAIKLLNLTGESDVLHENIIRVLNPEPYQTAITEMRNIVGRSRYLAEYGRYVEETVIFDAQYHVVIAILRDVTERESLKGKDEALRQRTVETADRVIDKQMRVVQEIASLLGETTAETKLALSKLKDAMSHE